MKEEMNLYKRCKNIFKSHGVDMGGSGFDFVIAVDTTDGNYYLSSGNYSDVKEKLLASRPVLGANHAVIPGEVAQTSIMTLVYYSYADEYIFCEEGGEGASTWKIYPDNTVENV